MLGVICTSGISYPEQILTFAADISKQTMD